MCGCPDNFAYHRYLPYCHKLHQSVHSSRGQGEYEFDYKEKASKEAVKDFDNYRGHNTCALVVSVD